MKSFRLLLTASMVMSSYNMHAVLVGLISQTNKQNNQKVILLSDMHMQALSPSAKKHLEEPMYDAFQMRSDEQQSIGTRFVDYLYNDEERKKCLITESLCQHFFSMARLETKAEVQARTEEVKEVEILFWIPRLLLRYIQSPDQPNDVKLQLSNVLEAKAANNYSNSSTTIRIHKQFDWIAGDSRDLNTDMMIGLCMPQLWRTYKELIEKKDSRFLEDRSFQKLNMGFFKKHLTHWQQTFKEKGFDNQCTERTLAITNKLLEQEEVRESDHLVYLYDSLARKNNDQELLDLQKDSGQCMIQKFDVELQHYLHNTITAEQKPDVTFILAGEAHTDYARKYLSDHGFETDYQIGLSQLDDAELEKPAFLQQLPDKIGMVNRALKLLLDHELQGS